MTDLNWQDMEISNLRWKLKQCISTLKWYASHLRPEDRLNDNGDKAKDVLEDINENKN